MLCRSGGWAGTPESEPPRALVFQSKTTRGEVSACCGLIIRRWGFIRETLARADRIVVLLPFAQQELGLGERGNQMLARCNYPPVSLAD
jgi:hypothetical protein